ncbi:MAG: methionyl-tRNA formyltransferase [Bacteroidales bacterium]
MKKLDRYLIFSFFGPFILTFIIVIFILVMQFLWLYIDELVGKGLGIFVILEFMGWASITLIPMALPLATLLASIMTLGGLGENNELLAMKSAGISLQRILVPLIGISAVICVGAFYISNDLIPIAYNKIYTLKDDIGKTKEEIKIPEGIFYDGIDGYILRVGKNNENTGMMYDMMVYDHTSNMGNTNITLADSGYIQHTPDKNHLIFKLYNGCSYNETNKISYRDTTLKMQKIKFNEQELILSLKNYAFSRSDDGRFEDEVMSKNLKSLRKDKDSLFILYKSQYEIQCNRMAYGIGLDYLYQLDTVKNKKVKRPFNLDSLYANKSKGNELENAREALNKIQVPITMLESFERESFKYVDLLRKIDIESNRKFTLSLACLIFFFIGAPLGAIIRKGGLGTPVIISIFFFVIYWVVDISGKKLARDGSLSPFIGTFISTAVLIPIGAFLTWKSTKDSSLFSIESYTLFFKGQWKKVKKLIRNFRKIFRKEKGNISIVYMGTPEFAVAPLDLLIKNKYEIAAIVTIPDKQSGRGLNMKESSVKKYAIENKIPILQPEHLKDPDFIKDLNSLNADLFIVVAFRMLPKEVWSIPRLGTFNLHASLLPQYRGAAPINWAIINGEKKTGVTTFMIDEQIDTGRILFQQECLIEQFDDAGTLHDKLQEIGSELVIKTVETISMRKIKSFPQQTYYTLKSAPKITKEICKINWGKSATEINLLIRGLSPYPTASSTMISYKGEINVKIFEAYVNDDITDDLPIGTIISDGKTFMSVVCGKQSLRITNIQAAGKKRLNIKDFLAGFRNIESYNFIYK